MSVYYADVQPMVARRHGQGGGGALAFPWKMYKAYSLQLQHYGSRTKRTQIVATRHISPAQNIPKLRLRAGLCIKSHWGAYSAPPAVFKGSASQQRKRAQWTGRKGRGGERRGGEVWRDGEEMERKEEVDFSPFCKNSCGRPWFSQQLSWVSP